MSATTPRDNHILASLPPSDFERLAAAALHPVTVDFKQELSQMDERHVYFPTSALIAMLHRMDDGRNIEVGSIGREGLVGMHTFFGALSAPQRYLGQIPGEAYRIDAATFTQLARPACPLHCRLLGYANVLLTQMSQWVACSVLHTVEQRCCRWLVMVRERTGRSQFPLTHDFLAQMLGVRRASVTEVARALHKAGLIRYRRGEMTILDLPGLEATACECYRRVKTEQERLLVHP